MPMSLHSKQMLRDVPDSPWLSQYQQGIGRLRFGHQLEDEYQLYVGESHLLQHRIATYTGLLVWLLFALLDVHYFRLLEIPISQQPLSIQLLAAIRIGVLIPLIMITWKLLVGQEALARIRQSALLLLLLALATPVVVFMYKSNLQLHYAEMVLTLVVVSCFYPLGIGFRQSLLIALCCCLMTLLLALCIPDVMSWSNALRLVIMLLLTTGIVAVGAYLHEHSQREQYLLRHILQQMATHDPLTGIGNRRHFSRHLRFLLNHSRRSGEPLCLVMLDVDHFKSYNDHYGHLAGDAALRQLGELLQRFARRPLDMAARLGGEEFALLLCPVDHKTLDNLLTELHRAIQGLGIEHGFSGCSSVMTASSGAVIAQPDDTHDSLCHRADKQLYRAKEAGRNCFRVDPAEQLADQKNASKVFSNQ